MSSGSGLGSGTLHVSMIEFYAELGKPDGRVIPLGVMAEISLPFLRGLGMIGRTELRRDEIELAGSLGGKLISRPFDYLSEQFDDAWANTASGKALHYLAARHLYSLHFSVPQVLEIPRQLLMSENLGATLKGAVREHLGSVLDDQMLRLTDPARNSPQEELLLFKAA
jgi:hypothetical protein